MVSGYYGFGNLGDEAILDILCNDLAQLGFPRQDVVVLSSNPEETAKEHGVQAVSRYDLPKIWGILGSTRCLVSGGGSLLQDITSKRSIPYYLGIVELAFSRKVPVVMYGQGIGPVKSPYLRRWIKRAFQQSAAFSVRDQTSFQFLVDLGVSQEKGELCADPVFQKEMVTRIAPEDGLLLLNIRPYELWEEQKELWLNLIFQLRERGQRVEFIPLGPGDWELGQSLQNEIPTLKVHHTLTLNKYHHVFASASLCISMRLHGVIFSALHDVLPLGLNYDPKVKAICGQLAVPYCEISDLANLAQGVGQTLEDADHYRILYRNALGELKKAALGNRVTLAQVLGVGVKT